MKFIYGTDLYTHLSVDDSYMSYLHPAAQIVHQLAPRYRGNYSQRLISSVVDTLLDALFTRERERERLDSPLFEYGNFISLQKKLLYLKAVLKQK